LVVGLQLAKVRASAANVSVKREVFIRLNGQLKMDNGDFKWTIGNDLCLWQRLEFFGQELDDMSLAGDDEGGVEEA
jgi:hypothetical protein